APHYSIATALPESADIPHPALFGDGGQVAHGVHEPAGRRAVAPIEVARNDRAGPAANTREHRDVLPAVGAAIGHRLPDDSGGGLVLPEHAPGLRVEGLEPAIHRAVENDIAGRHQRAAPHRKVLGDAPALLARERV